MSHLPSSLMNRLNKTESAVFKLSMLYFQTISFQIIQMQNNLGHLVPNHEVPIPLLSDPGLQNVMSENGNMTNSGRRIFSNLYEPRHEKPCLWSL